MFRKISDTFTATHFTILAAIAMLVPGALYGAVSYQNVAITDPGSGKQAYVDPGRRLYVYDQVAGYRNFPGYAVNIVFASSNGCQAGYQIPAGKALVLASETGLHIQGDTSLGQSQSTIWDAADCGDSSGKIVNSSGTSLVSADISQDFGNGIVIAAGKTIAPYSYNDNGYVILHGYLVPASTVPAASSAEAAYQGTAVTGATAHRFEGGQRP